MNRREFILGSASALAFNGFGTGILDSEFSDELNDLIEFSKTCKIVNTKDGVVNFKPRSYQIEYFKNILESKTFVCRKCRQCGATTMNLIYAHWMVERHPEKNVVVVFSNCLMMEKAKYRFNSMFPTNPSKWYENLPNVEFTTYGSFLDTSNRGYSVSKVGIKYPTYSSKYLNSDTIVLFDEYAFNMGEKFNYGKIFALFDSTKTVWISTPNRPKDMMWGDGRTTRTITRMKITGEQVFPQSRLEELRNCLGNECFNQEISIS